MRTEVEMDRYLLRPDDAAHVLSIGRSKLYELLASGRLPSVTIDGSATARPHTTSSCAGPTARKTARPSTRSGKRRRGKQSNAPTAPATVGSIRRPDASR